MEYVILKKGIYFEIKRSKVMDRQHHIREVIMEKEERKTAEEEAVEALLNADTTEEMERILDNFIKQKE